MDKKISVVIPNYNGRNLLAKHLPNVVQNTSGCEIIVVDDGSIDDSVSFIKKRFKEVKLISLKKNIGFAKATNMGVKSAKFDLVLLLNSDVSPKSGFLKPLLKYFDSGKIFAVGLLDQSHERGKIIPRGRGGVFFKKGFVSHFAAVVERGETLWVSAGSGLFDRKKFLDLDGFDPIFAPFYWEDIDLSFRAWQKGYKCFFEPLSKVDHFHAEGAIKKTRSNFYIKSVSYKNQFLFIWKNINDYVWTAQHILWLPYHFAVAILRFDWAFFVGFFWALIKAPDLIFTHQLSTVNDQLSAKEVLANFAKS